jgi:hypothetical protein
MRGCSGRDFTGSIQGPGPALSRRHRETRVRQGREVDQAQAVGHVDLWLALGERTPKGMGEAPVGGADRGLGA